jgi:eukaryotic-like serine/threonine-protein kinase
VGARPPDDDRPTVDLGPRPVIDAAEATAAATATAVHVHAPEEGGEGDDDTDDAYGADADAAAYGTDAGGHPAGAGPMARALTATVQLEQVHALPTQQLPPRRRTGSSPSQAGSRAGHTTASSPVDAMRLDEMQRTRVFLKAVLVICVGGILIALVSRGDPIARNVVLIGTACSVVGALWMLAAFRDQSTYDPRQMIAPGLLVVAGSMTGVYYWGVASPVAAMLVYGIYFFSLGSNATVTAFMYTIVATLHGALGLGITTGLLQDRGVVSMGGLRTLDQLSIVGIFEALYLVAFLTARASQRFTLDAMTKLQQAAHHVAQRDALLAEARAELDRALKIGGPGRFSDQVIGSFRLGVLIGRGGMGEVYEAHGTADRREAAVKLLHPGTLGDPTAVQRFLREARTASRLDCPHVVRVLEVGTTSGEIPFLAMERLRGSDLALQLRRHRRLGLSPAKLVAEQVALGLEAARTAGIVHRDLKPHNIFLSDDAGARRWKILDFGVSKAGGSGTLTKGHVVGTPAYMAPEQARGEDVDHRADVYSLAAILYRAITGHPAFTGKDVPTTLYEVVYRVPTQPSILAQLPVDIDRVLALGLAKRPDDRFETALELARWFTTAVDGALDVEQRRRADELIARFPWGTRPGGAVSVVMR